MRPYCGAGTASVDRLPFAPTSTPRGNGAQLDPIDLYWEMRHGASSAIPGPISLAALLVRSPPTPKTEPGRPPQGRPAASDRHSCRRTSPATPHHAADEPGEARGRARAHLSTGAEIRARNQPHRRQPVVSALPNIGCAD